MNFDFLYQITPVCSSLQCVFVDLTGAVQAVSCFGALPTFSCLHPAFICHRLKNVFPLS